MNAQHTKQSLFTEGQSQATLAIRKLLVYGELSKAALLAIKNYAVLVNAVGVSMIELMNTSLPLAMKVMDEITPTRLPKMDFWDELRNTATEEEIELVKSIVKELAFHNEVLSDTNQKVNDFKSVIDEYFVKNADTFSSNVEVEFGDIAYFVTGFFSTMVAYCDSNLA